MYAGPTLLVFRLLYKIAAPDFRERLREAWGIPVLAKFVSLTVPGKNIEHACER